MRVAILHQRVADDAPPDERDVLDAARVVREACVRLGHDVELVACDLDLSRLVREVGDADVAFNLVETLDGSGRLAHLVPAVVESRKLPCTGASAAAIQLTSSKTLSRRWMAGAKIPVPPGPTEVDGPFIVKPDAEDGSVGIDASSVVADAASATRLVRERGPGWFAEAFIEGREVNVSILDGEVLPPAEILFTGSWKDRPRIVGYAAKWDPETFEYQNTVRHFPHDLDGLSDLAMKCWTAFDLRGYARVDIRVDSRGRPFVLEVNANPCISPGAGFVAAAEQAHIDHDTVVDRILRAAIGRH